MKKFFVFLLMGIIFIPLTAQNEYTAKQEKLRAEISAYLKENGFSPEKQVDGLKFRHDDVNYYIEIDAESTKPMYLRLCRYIKYSARQSRDKVMSKLNDYNSTYGIKVACLDKSVVCTSEFFLNEAEDFTYSFPTMMSLLDSVCDDIIE